MSNLEKKYSNKKNKKEAKCIDFAFSNKIMLHFKNQHKECYKVTVSTILPFQIYRINIYVELENENLSNLKERKIKRSIFLKFKNVNSNTEWEYAIDNMILESDNIYF